MITWASGREELKTTLTEKNDTVEGETWYKYYFWNRAGEYLIHTTGPEETSMEDLEIPGGPYNVFLEIQQTCSTFHQRHNLMVSILLKTSLIMSSFGLSIF